MSAVLGVLATVALFAGLTISTVSAFGLLRFDRPMAMLHAGGLASVPGVLLVLAAAVGTQDGSIVARTGLIALFTVLTAPVTSHIIAVAAIGEESAAARDATAPEPPAPADG